MISTRVFSRNRSVWASITPTLEQVVRWINENSTTFGPPVAATGGEPANNAVIAELAFALVARGGPWTGPMASEIAEVRRYIASVGMEAIPERELDEDELLEVGQLAASLKERVGALPNAQMWPLVPGCGVVDSARADILSEASLFEVKSVSRPFRSEDVRQLLTYVAMYDAANVRIDEVGLLNPRLGKQVAASLEFISQGASGLTRFELGREIQRRMGEMQVSG